MQVSYPWEVLPRGLYSCGAGGIVGWRNVCGALNGTIGVMDILGVHNRRGNLLIDYFCTAQLPTDALVGWIPALADLEVPAPLPSLATSVSNSPLCRDSVSIWAATAGGPVADASKKDRCAKLVGDIVAYAVELMNAFILDAYAPPARSARRRAVAASIPDRGRESGAPHRRTQ